MKTRPRFDWLFIAVLKDGTIIRQTPEDEQEDSNQYGPVLERLDEVALFNLKHRDTGETWTVDLETGAFAHNGIRNHDFILDHDLKLIYLRHKKGSLNNLGEETDDILGYVIGYEYEKDGETIKETRYIT